jgi:peptidyl-prolyl cis-trans isomerase D
MPFQNRWQKGVNAKASHILISYEGTKVPNKKNNELKKKKVKAEALLAQIKANRIVS